MNSSVSQIERAGKSCTGSLFMTTTPELFGNGSYIQSATTAKAEFDLAIHLFNTDVGGSGAGNAQTFVNKVFGICRNSSEFDEIAPFNDCRCEEAIGIELSTT